MKKISFNHSLPVNTQFSCKCKFCIATYANITISIIINININNNININISISIKASGISGFYHRKFSENSRFLDNSVELLLTRCGNLQIKNTTCEKQVVL